MYFYGSTNAQPQQPTTAPAGNSGGGVDYQAPTGFTPTNQAPQQASQQPQSGGALGNLFGGMLSGIANSGPGKFVGNLLGGINNLVSPQKLINQNAPDTFSLLGNALSVPQRGLFTLAANQGPQKMLPGNAVPNFFDFTQDPGTQMAKYLTGGQNPTIDTGGALFGKLPISLGLGLLDPLLFLGGGSGNLAKVALSSGKEVGLATKGVQALKDLAQAQHGTSDLAHLGTIDGGKALDLLKQQVVRMGEKSNPEFFSKGGLQVAGKTVIPGDTFGAIKNKLTDNPLVNRARSSLVGSTVENGLRHIFNPRMTRDGLISEEDYSKLKQIFNVKNATQQKTMDFVKGIFSGLKGEDLNQFRQIAKMGIDTASGALHRLDLVGKPMSELLKIAPDVKPTVLAAYHTYINEGLPKLEQIARDNFNLGSDHLANDYLHEYKTGNLTKRQIFGSPQRPYKYIDKSGSTKAATQSRQIMDEAVAAGQDPMRALKDAGFEANPALTTGHLANERFMAEGMNHAIDNIVKASTKVSPKDIPQEWLAANRITKPTLKDAIKYYRDQGHGIYQPKGNLRFYRTVDDSAVKVSSRVPTYAVEAPMASRLNEFRAGNAQAYNVAQRAVMKLSNGLLKLDFVSPTFAAVHGVWHLAFNAFLENGGGALKPSLLGRAFDDVKNETPFFKALAERGAFPHHLDTVADKGALDKMILKAADGNQQREGLLRSLWSHTGAHVLTNPLTNNWAPNALLMQEDNFLRTLVIRNNMESRGMSMEEAIKRSNKYLVDYNNLTTTERTAFKMFMPFYAWTKGNLGAQAAAWIERPWRQLVPLKVQNALNQAFSGHNMAGNEPGQQQNIDTGKQVGGKEEYASVPLGSKDISSLINSPSTFIKNRAGQVAKAYDIAKTGTDGGYPVVDENSPTSPGVQKAAGIANVFSPMDMADLAGVNLPVFERKNFGIGLSSAQYPSAEPSARTPMDWLLKASGVRTSTPTSAAAKASYKAYAQRKYLRSLQKKGL